MQHVHTNPIIVKKRRKKPEDNQILYIWLGSSYMPSVTFVNFTPLNNFFWMCFSTYPQLGLHYLFIPFMLAKYEDDHQ